MRNRVTPMVALVVCSLMVLSIGINEDWRLLHEDNGAFYTSLALSHLRLGLGETRGHDFFVDARSGEKTSYGHHPPGLALALSAAMRVTGSQEPWVIRSVPIAFHVGSVLLMVSLLSPFVAPWLSVLGGLLLTMLPMGGFFGRMPNYEPLGLFAVMVQLVGWTRWRRTGARRDALLLLSGVFFGGLIDFAPLFFGIGIFLVEGIRWRRGRCGPGLAASIAACGIGIVLLDLAHLAFANRGSIEPFTRVVTGIGPGGEAVPLGPELVLGLLEFFRRYFTHSGLLASIVLLAVLLSPRCRRAMGFPPELESGLLRDVIAVSGWAALAYVLSAPRWARVHPYWQFYFLPFVVFALVLGVRSLKQGWDESGRAAFGAGLLVVLLEVIATSAYMLHLRHTRVGMYAVETTRMLRSRYLAPEPSGR